MKWMMSEMMKHCKSEGGKPDFKQMEELMNNCGFCPPGASGRENQPDAKETSSRQGESHD